MLVFRRPTATDKRRSDKIWFYEVRADGYDPDKLTGGGRPETPERNDIPALLQEWRHYRNFQYTRPPGVESGTLLAPGTPEPRCWWTTIAQVASNDYNLAAGRYKPQISQMAAEEDPAELIRAIIGIEREIAAGLEQLLADVEAVN